VVPDAWVTRALVIAGLACVLGTIMTRATVDIVNATAEQAD
jgi:hypothetical protein